MTKTQPNTSAPAITVQVPSQPNDLLALWRRMEKEKPSPEDRAAFRALLAERGDLWRAAGDIAQMARARLLDTFKGNPAIQESVTAGITQTALELAGKDAPLIERLLAEQAALCWAQYYLTHLRYSLATSESLAVETADYWERRLSSTQRRYLRSLEALARVRRLLRPGAVQVNIGQQVTAAQVLGKGKGDPAGPA